MIFWSIRITLKRGGGGGVGGKILQVIIGHGIFRHLFYDKFTKGRKGEMFMTIPFPVMASKLHFLAAFFW